MFHSTLSVCCVKATQKCQSIIYMSAYSEGNKSLNNNVTESVHTRT